ncbi:hypothetical protein [Actinocrispum wychmicini]|uniref:Tocopherol cyclase-like protein n=1 Tax=Actinocrispum wychmicini TaxID=1213861 RepID=A0A4R2JQW4_9PSEU|nr:hypothetical protein [Actinocrispum wychmicini]TCO62633.1 hypothetical protein EV192_102772 [Actinocrispum wychmicini]
MSTTFRETMAGTVGSRPMRMDLHVTVPGLLLPWSDVTAAITGHVTIDGLADAPATGTLRIAPLRARIIHYRCSFAALDGRMLHLDGHKSIDPRHPTRSMTTLPATVRDAAGAVVGEADLTFDIRRDLVKFLAGFRFPRDPTLMAPRWRGQPGRLEVWYTTFTDPDTKTGVWLHHEMVAPSDGGPPRVLGWAAVFPPGKPPVHGRFGPFPQMPANRLQGTADDVHWDLASSGSGGDPMFTFPRWTWDREILPAAQVVPEPSAIFNGTVKWNDGELTVRDGHGATARIYGHGNAEKWAWLHADLGDGDVLEIVSAVSRRWPLRQLRPLTFLRLRVGGQEWPARVMTAAPRLRASIGLPTWTVSGRVGNWRITVDVTQSADGTLALEYRDPDGAQAVCRNSERADARIVLEESRNGSWQVHRTWELNGTAHAEVGSRD